MIWHTPFIHARSEKHWWRHVVLVNCVDKKMSTVDPTILWSSIPIVIQSSSDTFVVTFSHGSTQFSPLNTSCRLKPWSTTRFLVQNHGWVGEFSLSLSFLEQNLHQPCWIGFTGVGPLQHLHQMELSSWICVTLAVVLLSSTVAPFIPLVCGWLGVEWLALGTWSQLRKINYLGVLSMLQLSFPDTDVKLRGVKYACEGNQKHLYWTTQRTVGRKLPQCINVMHLHNCDAFWPPTVCSSPEPAQCVCARLLAIIRRPSDRDIIRRWHNGSTVPTWVELINQRSEAPGKWIM